MLKVSNGSDRIKVSNRVVLNVRKVHTFGVIVHDIKNNKTLNTLSYGMLVWID